MVFYLVCFMQIGETIADKMTGSPLPAIRVEEPTVKMSFSINTSPFVGREVHFLVIIFTDLLFCDKIKSYLRFIKSLSLSLSLSLSRYL